MRTSEFYFYHGEREAPAPGKELPTVAHCMRKPLPPRPHDRLTSSVRNHSWWVSTQLRPQVQGQPRGQTMYAQPSEVRHEMHRPAPFVTGQLSTMSATSRLAPHLTSRPPWTHAPSRHEMYSSKLGFRTEDLHQMRDFSRKNITARLIAQPSGPMRGQYAVPQHVQRSVDGLARVWSPRSGTGRAASARELHSDLDNFEARLATRVAVPPAGRKPSDPAVAAVEEAAAGAGGDAAPGAATESVGA
jgi:hypothetical protein